MKTYLKELDYLVAQEETKGRNQTEKLLANFLKNYDYEIVETPQTCAVDMRGTVYNTWDGDISFCVECKQRNKTEDQLKKFPWVELRRDKLARIFKEGKGSELIYCVIVNETGYIFNLRLIQWDSIGRFEWYIKDKEVDSNSSRNFYTTYQIPFTEAIFSCKLK